LIVATGGGTATAAGSSATATQTQTLQATVSSQVAWGSAGGCTQNIQTNDFGALTPNTLTATLGSFDALPSANASTNSGGASVWVGCVTSNTTLASVTAQGTSDMTDGAGATLAMSNVTIGTTNNPVGGSCNITAAASSAGVCPLPNDGSTARTLVSNAPSGTNKLDFQYQLDLPANQPTGTYTGGQVTFTATAGT
jgi:hypothetical protein